MRIQELADITGISKRNIHFYIKEKLLIPHVNPANGYFVFSEEDRKRLILIKTLRKLGVSISVIRTILHRPATTEYYMRLHNGKLGQEIKELCASVEEIQKILEWLPANPEIDDLYKMVSEEVKEENGDLEKAYDGMLVNHFLWRIFWENDYLTEYQQFLWEKINRMTDQREKVSAYARLYDYLCSQDYKKIEALYKERNQHFNRVAAFSEREVLMYAEEMKQSVYTFIHSHSAVVQWKEHYASFISPQIAIYTGKIGIMAEEMCPFFGKYKKNSTEACRIVYEWLYTEEGQELMKEILEILQGYVNLENYNHAELESMNEIFVY